MSKVIIRGIPRGSQDNKLIASIKQVALTAFDDFSWLKRGDLVLLKVALNSNNPYPATTHPIAVRALAKLIISRGGRVLVGDQSGLEYCQQTPQGVNHLSSAQCYSESGMIESGIEFHGFEECGWDAYDLIADPRALHWPNGFHVTRYLAEVDHIISLPRISVHGMSGETLSAKNCVGYLREDDRVIFHAEGPLYPYIKLKMMGTKLIVKSAGVNDFFEKIVEIGLAEHNKLRGVLFVATEAQTTMGPNNYLISLGKLECFKSFIYKPKCGLIIASQDSVAADAAALAVLTEWYENTPSSAKFLQKILLRVNNRIKELGTYPLWQNSFLAHSLCIGLGSKPSKITYFHVPAKLRHAIDRRIFY